ncbi:MAG: thiaminase II [Rhodospirillales bacterium]|nr:thiaminase II [Rhodospirillales bacterium]
MPAGQEGFFAGLRDAAGEDWRQYVAHPFVKGLGDGTLPEAAFRHYLVQDYLFLIQFARAYGLAAYKADTLAEIRAASDGLKALVDVEMDLHRAYCADWGLDETALEAADADGATLAYTSYVLERGLAGDLLDLRVALAPCVVGYGEIGARLAADLSTRTDGNPYASWIEMYAGGEYQAFMRAEISALDGLAARRGGPARFDSLAATFRAATRLEAAFWQAGLDAA